MHINESARGTRVSCTGAVDEGGGFWRHTRHASLWLPGVALLCGMALNAQETLLYVPYVDVTNGTLTLSDGRVLGVGWQSNLTFFNNSFTSASWRWVAAYCGGERLGDADPYCRTSTIHDVLPGTGTAVGSCFVRPPSGGVAILVLGVTGQLISHSTVSKVHTVFDCTEPGGIVIPQGRVPVPTYVIPFAAGSMVVSGDIDLGDTGFGSCVSANQQYARRVNVTMFNLGDLPALFQIEVRAGVNSSKTYYQQTVSIPAKDVLQINSLPLSLDDVAQQPGAAAGGGTAIWVLITADEPFLSYVSMVFDNAEAGAMPMEVYPSHLRGSSATAVAVPCTSTSSMIVPNPFPALLTNFPGVRRLTHVGTEGQDFALAVENAR